MPIRKKIGKAYKGIPVSPGFAIGRAHVLNRFHLCVLKHVVGRDSVKGELERFERAVEGTRNKMLKTARESVKNLAENMSYILNPQIQLLQDPMIIGATKKMIEQEMVNAEWALQQTYNKLSAKFKNIKNSYFRERLHDLGMVINQVTQVLTGTEQETLESVEEPVIVISHDLSPFDTAQMATSKILGFVTEVGGKTSHTGIIATSLHIPALVGVKRITDIVKSGDTLIVDAVHGDLLIYPSEENFQMFNKKQQDYLSFDRKLESEVGLATETKDGIRVDLKGNIETSRDIKLAVEHGAEGIGLYRTEFLYRSGRGFPSEGEQFDEFKKVAESVAPHDAVLRTLDIGGDKMPAGYDDEPEPNPALGLRAIRYCLDNRQMFRSQLRAMLRASHYGKIKIMYPMIGSVEEIRKTKSILEKQKKELRREGIPFDENIKVGMMVEIPSTALLLDQFAPYVDFVSIGTNDLIQYLLAIDRANEKVAHLYEPLHPAVLRMLYMIIDSANRHNIPVSVCGKMSADPIYAYLLLGMGTIADLSMEPYSIPKIKSFIRNISVKEAREDLRKVLEFGRVRDIRKYLLEKVSHLLEDGLTSEVLAESYGKGIFR